MALFDMDIGQLIQGAGQVGEVADPSVAVLHKTFDMLGELHFILWLSESHSPSDFGVLYNFLDANETYQARRIWKMVLQVLPVEYQRAVAKPDLVKLKVLIEAAGFGTVPTTYTAGNVSKGAKTSQRSGRQGGPRT